MPHRTFDSLPFVPLAIVFECGLGFLGLALARWWDLSIHERLVVNLEVLAWGLAATLPPLCLLAWLMRTTWQPMVELRRLVQRYVGEPLRDAPWAALLLLAVAAGVGEEILFRGALQPWVAAGLGVTSGLVVASLVFGLLHAASPTYFVLATLAGGYFGWLAEVHDLVVPIVAHALYDFVALMVLKESTPKQPHTHSPEIE
jgi:membrane protease YdiL (CAAX protease family)